MKARRIEEVEAEVGGVESHDFYCAPLSVRTYDRISYRRYGMNLTVYIPRSLQRTLRQRAQAAGLTPARYLQQLLRQDVEAGPKEFSANFANLAGSWDDERAANDVIRDIENNRIDSERLELA
jgi:siderophore synthetase component